MSDEIQSVGDWATNAELIADVAALGWLRDEYTVLDTTYGKGNFWTKYRPPLLTGVDRNPAKSLTGEAVDFRHLPYPDRAFDVVVFDPPYRLNGTPDREDFDESFGIEDVTRWQERMRLIAAGSHECARVARRNVLVKVQDQVCVDEATEILTLRGWLSCDEVAVGDIAYTLNHETGLGEWQPITDLWILPSSSREMVAMEQSGHSSMTTLDHQWAVIRNGRRTWTMSRTLAQSDAFPIAAVSADQPAEPKYTDEFVELVAWFWTEGSVGGLDGRRGGRVRAPSFGAIYQSPVVNPANCARIERCLASCFGPPGPCDRIGPFKDRPPQWERRRKTDRIDTFALSANLVRLLLEVAPGKVPSVEFLRTLTTAQVRLFIETAIAGDGHDRGDGSGPVFIQKSRSGAELFQIACALAGIATSISQRSSGMFAVLVRKSQTTMPARRNQSRVEHTGRVWCVTTPTSTWLARRRGTMWFTGNCSGKMRWQSDVVTDIVISHGFRKADRFDYPSRSIPQPEGRAQRHARHSRSQLLVFTRGRVDNGLSKDADHG